MSNIFPKSLTIELCEEFIRRTAESRQENEELILPVDTTKTAFAGFATAIQAINTWSKKTDQRRVTLRYSVTSQEDRIKEIINRPHKFCAAMYAKTLARQDENGDTASLSEVDIEFRRSVNEAARIAIEAQSISNYGQQHGRLCWFAFVDHSTKGFDRNFYRQAGDLIPKPRQPAQITAIIKAMVEKSTRVAGGGKPLNEEDADNLGRLFYELFINTHEHGSRGKSRSDWIKPAVRVIYTNAINMATEDAESSLRTDPVLQAYTSSKNQKFEDRSRYVEISIIDAGLGYCGRWLADYPEENKPESLSIHKEYEVFKNCFTFRQTSSGDGNKGLGLPVVMERLTKLKGFMRVRSGRLSLYRDFIESPYEINSSCDFFDWTTRLSAQTNSTTMPSVAGVAITLLIPLGAK